MSKSLLIAPGVAEFVLSGVNRLDAAITALGCVMTNLHDDPARDDHAEVCAIRWLYEMLRDEADNIRKAVKLAQEPQASQPDAAGTTLRAA